MKLLDKAITFYENKRLFRANPCDRDAHWFAAPFGQALAYFGSHCPCCSGARVLLAVVLAAMWPVVMLWAAGALFVVAFMYSVFNPEPVIVLPPAEPVNSEEAAP